VPYHRAIRFATSSAIAKTTLMVRRRGLWFTGLGMRCWLDAQWLNIRGPLKLKYACEHGFEPGLWLPSEVEVEAGG
jgi:hypothetical protein